MTFYVIDTNECAVTWPATDDAKKGEQFASMKAAQKRAEERAEWDPGTVFAIVQTVAVVQCPIGKPQITKR